MCPHGFSGGKWGGGAKVRASGYGVFAEVPRGGAFGRRLTNRRDFSYLGRDLDYAVGEGEFLGLAVAPSDAD